MRSSAPRPPLRRIVLAVALAVGGSAAEAADEPVEVYRRAVRTLEQEERVEGEGLDRRVREALTARRQARFEFRMGQRASLDEANEPVAALWAPFEAREARRAQAQQALAASGAARAASTLYDALLDTVVAAEALDQEMLAAHPIADATTYDPVLAFRRSALARREAHLLEALATVPGAADLLGPRTWTQAAAADGKRSAVRRIAFLDAAGRLPAPQGIASLVGGLASDLVCLRQAALEAAARQGGAGATVLAQALDDPSVLVRRAALAGLRRLAPADGAQLARVLERLPLARGAERDEVLATLRTLAGRDLGGEPATWRAWLETQADAIATGRFDARAPATDPGPTVPPAPPGPRFLGLPLTSERLVFVLDWTLPMTLPVDVAFARTRRRVDWFGADDAWVGERGHERVQTLVRRELQRVLGALPPEARFGAVILRDGNRDPWPRIAEESVLGRPRLLAPERANLARLDRALGDVPPGWSRWHEVLDGLWHAADLARLGPGPVTALGEPGADTLVYVGAAEQQGGRFLLPEESVAAFARWNRFRRLVVHTVQVGDEGRDAERLLRGLAEASGGRHVHVTHGP